jgi:uncharacterized repeat protein (TIGR01451 family)
MRARQVVSMSVATVLLAVGISAPASAQTPSARLGVAFAPGSPAPPVLNQLYRYAIDVGNDGGVPLDNLVIIDTVPVELTLSSVTTGSYTGLSDFAAGEGVRVSYEKNTAPGVFTLWGSSPATGFNTTLTAPPPGLGAGEYITRVRWENGQAAAGMQASARPQLAGRVLNPDNSGGPVAVGDTIQNCAALTATGGGTPVTRNACQNFALIAGPAIAIQAPDSTPLTSAIQATATLSGGAPTGSLTFRVFAASDSMCMTALTTLNVAIAGVGAYPSGAFTAGAAGAYKWVAGYGGDALHAASATGCNDPAGAFAVVAPPTLSADFGAEEIGVGESTALTFTITNPAANTVPMTGVALENTLPAGLVVASPNGLSGSCGTGTITAGPGSQSVSLVGGTIPIGSSCSFSVLVTSSAPGSVTNTTGAVQSANGGTGGSATASLTVRAAPPAPPAPTPNVPPATTEPLPLPRPLTAEGLAVACSPADLVLLSMTKVGRRVRFRGLADPEAAGQRVRIRGEVRQQSAFFAAAQSTVRSDGSFEATGRVPDRKATTRTRYFAQLGDRRSPALKLTRRLGARVTASTDAVTISGRVTPPLARPIRRVRVTRLTSCAAGYEVVARVKPDARGRFRVTLPRTTGAGPALYLAQTRVRSSLGRLMPASSNVLMTE